jgi:DNA-binding beta-propeller fold protein YncE
VLGISILSACQGADDSGDPPGATSCTGEPGTVCTWAGTGQAGWNGEAVAREDAWLYFPMDVEFSPYGEPVVTDWNNHRLRGVDDLGLVRTVVGTGYVGDGDLDHLDATDAGAPGLDVLLNHPSDVHYDVNGLLWIAAWHNHKIRTWDPGLDVVRLVCGASAGFAGDDDQSIDGALLYEPRSVDLADNGTLVFLDQRNPRIRVITVADTIHTLAGTGTSESAGDDGPALDASFAFDLDDDMPAGGMALAPDGRVYVADTGGNRIRVVDDGKVATVAGSSEPGFADGVGGAARFRGPRDIELDGDTLWVADTDNHALRAVDLTTGEVTTVAGTGEPGFCGDGGPAADATFDTPFGVALDLDGNVYVTDTYNHRIRVIAR